MEINFKKTRGTHAKGFASDIIATPEILFQIFKRHGM